jgi:hypothetical protein
MARRQGVDLLPVLFRYLTIITSIFSLFSRIEQTGILVLSFFFFGAADINVTMAIQKGPIVDINIGSGDIWYNITFTKLFTIGWWDYRSSLIELGQQGSRKNWLVCYNKGLETG